jgi:hypothetical protein
MSSIEQRTAELVRPELEIVKFDRQLARKHAVGQFAMLEHDTTMYPFQGGYVHEGSPQPADVIEAIADGYDSRFSIFKELSEKDPNYAGMIEHIANTLSRNQNVVIAMDHGDLVNIAVGWAALHVDLQRLGVSYRSVTPVNKPVQHLGVKKDVNGKDCVVPTFGVLALEFDATYSTYSKADSTRSGASKQVESQIEKHTKRVIPAFNREKRRGGTVIVVAASGRTDRKNGDEIVLGSVHDATAKLLTDGKGHDMHVVFMAARGGHKGEPPVFEVASEIMNPAQDEFHLGYRALSRVLTKKTGKKFIYEGPEKR